MKKLLSITIFFALQIPLFAQDNTLTPTEKKDGWKLLWDGKTTNGWKGAFIDKFPEKGWKIENGEFIVIKNDGGESTNGGDIITTDYYDNFELTLEAKLTPGANSGVKYFVDPTYLVPKGSAKGLEFQLLDDERHPDAKMGRDGNRTIGSLYDLITADVNKKPSPIGEWNKVRILSKNMKVEHWLNGMKVVDYERGSDKYKELISISKYKDVPEFGMKPKGPILLQDHGDEVHFKNIKLRKL
jgi:hypothetical protein